MHPARRASTSMQGPVARPRAAWGIGALLLLAATACAAAPRTDAAGTPRPQNDLTIRADAGDGSAPKTWTLACDGAAKGTHPDPAAACAHLQRLHDPFAPLPGDVACTEQFGGSQTAHVTGVWSGNPVDLELTRTDGCRISQWDHLGPLLPMPVG
jgi:hypothetical protein